MKFRKWVAKAGGPKAVARLIDAESPRVMAWLKRRAIPKALTMEMLVRLGKGAFGYQDIIDETRKLPKTAKKKKATVKK